MPDTNLVLRAALPMLMFIRSVDLALEVTLDGPILRQFSTGGKSTLLQLEKLAISSCMQNAVV